MITHIDHYPYERVYRINDDGTDVHWMHRPVGYVRRYYLGHEPPNYSVPAIRYEVDIEPDRVILWDWTTPFAMVKYLTG